MCGIYGDLRFDGEPVDRATGLEAMDLLSHRGPDSRGSWSEGNIFLGMRRLSIIDLDSGDQPIWNERESMCIVYNGELYNFLDLRPRLEGLGHRFRTQSDTEVVLHAFEEWGSDCLKRFNGMFAFAIWDRRRQSLFLARDRIGEKPLYYRWDGKRLTFGSELKAIVSDPSIPREVDPAGLANYLMFSHAVAPQTIYKDIYKLRPGHFLEAQAGAVSTRKYWDVGDEPQPGLEETASEADLTRRILELVDDSVRRRMVADVPVGAFLSGGVDSSGVAALMQKHATRPVKTFSLGFKDFPAYNELNDSRRVAEYLGTEHYELEVDHLDWIDTSETLVYHYDEPFNDAARYPLYLLSRFARQQVKVALAGDGGDELFGGYRRYAAEQIPDLFQPLLSTFSGFTRLVQYLPRLRRIKQALNAFPIQDPTVRYASWLQVFDPDLQAKLLKPEVLQAASGHDLYKLRETHYRHLKPPLAADHLNRLMYTDFKTLLVDCYMEKTDKASMACGLEVRLPLLDHRLVELAFQIPSRHKIRGWSTKRILKKSFSGPVPPSVLKKPKQGFSVPTDPWFRGVLKDYVQDMLLGPRARSRGFFEISFVERLLKEHVEGRHVWDRHLGVLLNFELWCQIYLDGRSVGMRSTSSPASRGSPLASRCTP